MNKSTNTGDNIAIKVEGVHKDFILPHESQDSIKSKILHPFRTRGESESQHALKNISFHVKKGEFFGIVGRNGSGKSTLLKILAEIYTPTKGRVTVNGSLTPFIELGVGFNPELTGRENVYLNGAMLGFSKKEMAKLYHEIVEFAELEKFMDQKLKNYSSGMQVRLAFSVAIRARSDILLLDEVLAVGDADFQRKCFDYFRDLKKNKETVVFVTHDMSAVREYCDRAILIDKSEIIAEGNPREISTKYTRLFETDTNSEGGTEGKRWGEGKLSIKHVKIAPDPVKSESKNIKLTIEFQSSASITSESVIGFNIHRSDGIIIQGSNSKIHQAVLKPMDAGNSSTIFWDIPNIFEEGTYLIDVAITSSDFSRTYDWWEDCVKLKVYRDERTPYIVSPAQLKISLSDVDDWIIK